ncbi:MAG TPA: YbjN domain-containing protein [Acidimicrobiia bacterium]|nr:YbjN domain-containing protein [Acidimicrobiia bacterium]
MTESPLELLERVTAAWVDDPDGDVVWAGDHEGRHGVRMRQSVRDFTTVWFSPGERTVAIEAHVLPAPPVRPDEVYRQALARNAGTRRIHFALDREGDLVLVGRIPLSELTEEELEFALGEVYEMVEVSFLGLVAAGFDREKET